MRSTAPFVYVVAFVLAFGSAFGCGGGGCACMTPIPGGFPADQRTPNAAQIRVSETGLQALTADPQALVEGLTGGPLTFDVPANCDGTPSTCCVNGQPVSPCGPIVVDLGFQDGDAPRLELQPADGASRLDVVVRARVHTEMEVPITLGADCLLSIDTGPGGDPDLQINAEVDFVQDPDTGTTRVQVGTVTISQFTADDYDIGGGGLCPLIDFGSQFFIDTLTGTFADAIRGAIEDQTCKACPSGDVAECGPAAAACTDGVCMKANDTCVQELGVTGRMLGALPGTTGGIDLYEVAGGYATTDDDGIALGLLGGMLPAGQARDRCGPPGTAPAAVTIPQSTFFQGNQRPDTNAPFDIAIGVHQNQLDRFAYSAYDGGMLCLTVGSSTVDLINTGSIGLFIPSLSKLANTAAPMAIGLRPQAPPTIVLGPNTFLDDGMGNLTVDEPLLDLTFGAMEIDFFAMVEGQYIRIFTLVADVHLPVGLDVGAAGDIIPVLGDLEGAFSNITVKNSEALLETPEELADIFPTILQLALGQLGGLGSFDVPELGGLQVSITEITAVDDNTFLAIFGELMPAMAAAAPRADTTAMIARVDVPPTATFADARRWRGARRPTVELSLGGGAGLEWQTRVDGVSWSAWSPHAERTLAADTFWVQGRHTIEVRARRAGQPWTADLTPVVMHTLIDTIAPTATLESAPTFVRVRGADNVATERLAMRYRFGDGAWIESPIALPIALAGRDLASLTVEVRDAAGNAAVVTGAAAKPAPFHGAPGEGGCSCGASSPGAGGGLLVLLTAALLLRPRRRVRRAAAFVLLCGLMPACDCGSDPPCGDVACLEGDVEHGPVGKHNSVASDGTRTVVSTYDQRLGDLVVVDVIPGSEPVHVAVDGIPDETPTHEPSSYRGGIEGAGTDVGWWTSIALHDGAARVAYQDVTFGDLRFARENDSSWTTYTIDGDPATAGWYASLALDASGAAAIAYVATGVDDGSDTRAAELRLARAGTENPDEDEWTITTLASAPSSCGGLCGAGTECVEPLNAGEPEVCAAPTGDCAAACSDTEACVAGVCRAVVGEPLADHPQGTGLFATAMFLADGRVAVVHYDRARTALVLLVESAAGSSSFTETILDDAGDRGFWASAVTDGNTIHVAYQDALGDQLLYVAWNGTVQPVELVDDGVREGDRTHPVGAGASIYLDGATPAIAYQDGLVADLVLARRDGGTWTHEAIATGALLDGFHVAATSNGPWIVWDSADITRSPVTTLQIREP